MRIQALGAYLVVNGALPVPKSPDDRNFHDIDTSHPPNAAAIVAATRKTVTVNGYAFDHDVLRTWRAFGYLALGPTAKRSGRAQSSAGGANRLPSDHGGHFISSIFNGPGSAINLFPQDARFNQSDYKKLEIGWRNDLQAGRRVYVDISASYTGLSKRPEAITVVWYVNGKRRMRTFQNGPKGK